MSHLGGSHTRTSQLCSDRRCSARTGGRGNRPCSYTRPGLKHTQTRGHQSTITYTHSRDSRDETVGQSIRALRYSVPHHDPSSSRIKSARSKINQDLSRRPDGPQNSGEDSAATLSLPTQIDEKHGALSPREFPSQDRKRRAVLLSELIPP